MEILYRATLGILLHILTDDFNLGGRKERRLRLSVLSLSCFFISCLMVRGLAREKF